MIQRLAGNAAGALLTWHDQEFSLGLSSYPKGTREGKGKKRPGYRYGKNTTLRSSRTRRFKIVSSG
ncbi:MAG: hypothetical protein J0M29_03200 [Chitinophagales bacterium]|nr:hypothetical protein [Chitinophagales bacterium]